MLIFDSLNEVEEADNDETKFTSGNRQTGSFNFQFCTSIIKESEYREILKSEVDVLQHFAVQSLKRKA